MCRLGPLVFRRSPVALCNVINKMLMSTVWLTHVHDVPCITMHRCTSVCSCYVPVYLCHREISFNVNLLEVTFCCLYLFIEELGPLNSDWFEDLTVRASEGGPDDSVVVQHDTSAQKDEEGIFRAPAKTPVVDSQMCSTPKIFRRRRPHSPASGLVEGSPNLGRNTEHFKWM